MNEILFQFYKIFTHGIMGLFFTVLSVYITKLSNSEKFKKVFKKVSDIDKKCEELGINPAIFKAIVKDKEALLELMKDEKFKDRFVEITEGAANKFIEKMIKKVDKE